MKRGLIFPTVTGSCNLDRNLTEKEEETFKRVVSEGTYANQGNVTTTESYILDTNIELKNLKTFFEEAIKTYVDTFNPTNSIEFYITQSWLNITEKNQYHHRHIHPNSIISGVFYLSCIDNDKIQFHMHEHQAMNFLLNVFDIENYNENNSHTVWYWVEPLDLVLFPSHLIHDVPINETDQQRMSLSFNTYFRGEIGSKDQLTQVVLK